MSERRSSYQPSGAPRDAQSGTVPLDFNAAPRAAQALKLRRLGYTYGQIAERLGYANESGARKAVKTSSRHIVRDEAREYLGWQLDMLDEALAVVNRRIVADNAESLWAVDRLTPLLARLAALLGLDAAKAKEPPALLGPVIREYPDGVAEAV